MLTVSRKRKKKKKIFQQRLWLIGKGNVFPAIMRLIMKTSRLIVTKLFKSSQSQTCI